MKNDWKDKMLEKVFDWQGDGVIYYEEAISICEQEIDRAREEGRENGVSNCCGAEVYPHNANDNTSRCTECKEGCTVVYF